jgi:hypothetical protein
MRNLHGLENVRVIGCCVCRNRKALLGGKTKGENHGSLREGLLGRHICSHASKVKVHGIGAVPLLKTDFRNDAEQTALKWSLRST